MTDQDNALFQQNLFDIYTGILFNNQSFAAGLGAGEITYDFSCPEYRTLVERYGIDRTAGEGTAFDRSVRLLHWMAPRLTHKGDYDNHVPVNALDLLEYSLDNPAQGINCVNKAKILAECCLALGIYARRAHLMPYSPYDGDNHVVTEVYDPEKGWVMLDPSMDGYFVDRAGRPLSVLAMREGLAEQASVSFALCGEDKTDIQALMAVHREDNAYFAKNLFRIAVDRHNGFGDGDREALWLVPAGCDVTRTTLANIDYRMRRYPAGEEAFRKWRESVQAQPAPPPQNVELFTAPPQ